MSRTRRICGPVQSSVTRHDSRVGLALARSAVQGKHMAGLSFDLIALQLFAGLALGAIYVLFAIGLSLIFGMLTVVNFAHGAFYMVGAYIGLYMLMLGGNFWLCLVAVPVAVAAWAAAGPVPVVVRSRTTSTAKKLPAT